MEYLLLGALSWCWEAAINFLGYIWNSFTDNWLTWLTIIYLFLALSKHASIKQVNDALNHRDQEYFDLKENVNIHDQLFRLREKQFNKKIEDLKKEIEEENGYINRRISNISKQPSQD